MNVLQQLQAGIRVEFQEAGRFLRILASEQQDKIRVQFYRNGAMISEALEVGRGYSETMEDANFDSYAVTSSVTQNVNIVTRASSRILYDTPPVGDVNVLSLPPVVIANNYFQYGASFKSSSILTANVAEVVVAPGVNTNGIIVWDAGFTGRNGVADTSKLGALIAKSSAPTNVADGDLLVESSTFSYFYSPSGVSHGEGRLNAPLLVPAGMGIYFISNVTEAIGWSLRKVLYTIR